MLDKFIQIIEENGLRPEDIERVEAQPNPMTQFKFSRQNTLRTPDDYGFSLRYLVACAAHRINPTRWHDLEVREDPRLRKFIQRVEFSITIDEKDFSSAKLEDPRTSQQRVKVVAKGRSFSGKSPYPKGGWYAEELRNTDEELIKKFTDNASGILPSDKVSKTAQSVLELEKLGDVAQFAQFIVP